MNAEVIDEVKEGKAICYLIRAKLAEYIASLPEDYRDYEVQREIVNNIYLDNLIQTILEFRHIPQMVLVMEDKELKRDEGKVVANNFKVLDGLQRTFRLKVIYDTIQLIIRYVSSSPEVLSYGRIQLSRQFRQELNDIKSSAVLMEKLLNYIKLQTNKDPKELLKLFDRWQWFELWVGLEPHEEINKMLILNAGHKAVKNQHQLELLFSNMMPLFKKMNYGGFEVIRERQTSSMSYSKNRIQGQFHFSHLITSILSFNSGKPITNNVNLIQNSQSEDFDDTIFDKLISYDFIDHFIGTLTILDKKLTAEYDNVATRWLGRETSLNGLFAACGRYSKEHKTTPIEALNQLGRMADKKPFAFNLIEFERMRNSLNLAKVNIGSVNKKAVFQAVFDLLIGKTDIIDWQPYFNRKP